MQGVPLRPRCTAVHFAGQFVDGFDPNGTESTQAVAAPIEPPKPPDDPVGEDPEDTITTAGTSTPTATPRQQPTPTNASTTTLPATTATNASATAPAAAPVPAAVLPGVPPLLPAFVRHALNHSIDQQAMDYRFGDMLGDTFVFYEAQHSGNISDIEGGNRHGWRGPQMLNDGSDVDIDLTGGLYEAGSAPLTPSAP